MGVQEFPRKRNYLGTTDCWQEYVIYDEKQKGKF